MSVRSPLDFAVPRNQTATMQLLQRLVGREGHRYWCGGAIAAGKVTRFLDKMAGRYPAILRNTRERSYDRRRGRAAMHMILCSPMNGAPAAQSPLFQWWLLSDNGPGGLADPSSADAHVAGDAMSANGHLIMHDYVLLYATKRAPHTVTDRRTGHVKRVWTDTSSWTWRIRGPVMAEIRASVDACCQSRELGITPLDGGVGTGLRGLLAAQRARPLFAGVRNQVIDLHRYAGDVWSRHRAAWVAVHPRLAEDHGSEVSFPFRRTRELIDILPTMRQIRIYDTPARTIADLLGSSLSAGQ